jgi:hypothetical protein
MTVLLHTIDLNEECEVYKFDIHYTTEDAKSTKIVYCIRTFGLMPNQRRPNRKKINKALKGQLCY